MAWDDGDGAVGDHGKWRVHSHKEGFVSKEQGVMQRTLALKEQLTQIEIRPDRGKPLFTQFF
jgi:hypothetical protein